MIRKRRQKQAATDPKHLESDSQIFEPGERQESPADVAGPVAQADGADGLEEDAGSAADDGQDRRAGQAPTADSELERELASVTADLQSYRDRYLRLAAEYDNFRKRTERERTEDRIRAQAQIVNRVLEAIDDFERVTQVDSEKTPAAALLEGVQLVERKLFRILEGAGLEIIDAAGKPFDPEEHEALAAAPTEDRDKDETVADVFQKGYRFKGTLLRPARVRVYKHED
jgi:molecular chaperone GrpE